MCLRGKHMGGVVGNSVKRRMKMEAKEEKGDNAITRSFDEYRGDE